MFAFKKRCLSVAALIGLCVLLSSCRARDPKDGPSIEFTRVPLAAEGGPDNLDIIEGRVTEARPGQKIILFARWGPWWVQPLANQPFTTIQPDSTWRNSTHYGTEYAALLVDPEYQPLPTMAALPSEGRGVLAVKSTKGRPVFWQTWWFLLSSAFVFVAAVGTIFRLRMERMTRQLGLRVEERLVERSRIAQELHDTLLQDFLSVSMQLHVANEQLADDSPGKPAITRVLGLMGRVIEQARNTVQGLRSSNWGSQDLEQAFSRVPRELAITQTARFRVIVEGTARPLRPVIGDDIYLIGREAIANAFRHSGASDIECEIRYDSNYVRLLVRDNGRGIAGDCLWPGREGPSGLTGMRERSDKIGGNLRVLSREEAGTEVELSVPSEAAYLASSRERSVKWRSKLNPQKINEAGSSGGKGQV